MCIKTFLQLFLTLFIGLGITIEIAAQTQTNITGPAGSGTFGTQVTVLPNGNIVVTDPGFDLPGTQDVGAVYLYDGATLALISRLTGSTEFDSVGLGGVTVLTNGNYVVSSGGWNNPSTGVFSVGAATWCDAATGINGEVSSANSIIGSTQADRVGIIIVPLTNGNYVVSSPVWNDPTGFLAVGAATWGNGTGGTVGEVSNANSLVGSSGFDSIGFFGITPLSNGNYVVLSSNWDNPSPAIEDVGAVTWGNGLGGTVGIVSSSNSLVGSTFRDNIGFLGITPLTNGNYVVSSGTWDNPSTGQEDVGAVTWGNGSGGTAGVLSSANSLIGSTASDVVGIFPAKALTNGNYVVSSPQWDNFSTSIADVGAVTWGNGTSGTSGVVSSANSLIGSTDTDAVGLNGIAALANGNYVVNSQFWDNPSTGIADVGAVTWGNGTVGTIGVVSGANSLVGSTANDNVGNNGTNSNNIGSGAKALPNGNYVVVSSAWDNPSTGITDIGAVTVGNGTGGTVGEVSSSNSLIGSTTGDQVGSNGVAVLTNSNYVVSSPLWNNPSPAITDVGAVTWINSAGETVGVVSASNSLTGSTANDRIGSNGITPLTNGNYVISSSFWDRDTNNFSAKFSPNAIIEDAGAVTFGNGISGTSGTVSSANSFVGSTALDRVGDSSSAIQPLTVFPNGNYAFTSPSFDNGGIVDAGAVTYGNGNTGITAVIDSVNSVLGTTANRGSSLNFSFDTTNNQLVVGRPFDNIVTVFRPAAPTAANVTVSGRVFAAGRGLPRVFVVMTDSNGTQRTAQTNMFGYYRFEDVGVGQTYIFNVKAKQYSFDSQVVNVADNLTDLNFTARTNNDQKSLIGLSLH